MFSGVRQSVRVTNSLFAGVGLVTLVTDSVPPGSRLAFAHTTFVQKDQNNRHQVCGAVASNRTVIFENTISAPLQAFDAFASTVPGSCTFLATILGRQTNPPPGTTVADPLFVDVEGGNFHLLPTSSAIDSAASGTITVVTENNSLVITDTEEGLAQAERLMAQLDKRPKQVMIEARIVEINLNNGFDIGVTWELWDNNPRTDGRRAWPWSRAGRSSREPAGS